MRPVRARAPRLPWPVARVFFAGALGLAAPPSAGRLLGQGAARARGGRRRLRLGRRACWSPRRSSPRAAVCARAGGSSSAGGAGGGGPTPALLAAGEEEDETTGAHGFTPPVMLLAGGALVVAGLVFGLVPTVLHGMQNAAASFSDRAAYAATVLHGGRSRCRCAQRRPRAAGHPVRAPQRRGRDRHRAGGAVAALARARRPAGADARPRARLLPLRRLHSGQIGDYVAWLSVARRPSGSCWRRRRGRGWCGGWSSAPAV